MNDYRQEQHIPLLTIIGVSIPLSAYARHQVLISVADSFTSTVTFIFSLLILYAGFLLIRSLLYELMLLFLKQRQETVPQAPSLVAEVVSEDMESVKPTSTTSFDYSECKRNALELRLNEELEKVKTIITYSQETLIPYISEEELKKLCEELWLFLTSQWNQDEAQAVTISSELKTIDLMHFGWNIGTPFKKKQGQAIQEVYEKLEETNTLATKNIYVLFDVKRWAEWVAWAILILVLSATVGWAVHLHSSNKTLQEQSLKYRVLRMEDKADREVYLQLDSLFESNPSKTTIRQLQQEVTQYEKALQRQAELLHQQQQLTLEQERLYHELN